MEGPSAEQYKTVSCYVDGYPKKIMIYWPYEMKRLVITGVRTGKIIRAIMPKLVIFYPGSEYFLGFLKKSI